MSMEKELPGLLHGEWSCQRSCEINNLLEIDLLVGRLDSSKFVWWLRGHKKLPFILSEVAKMRNEFCLDLPLGSVKLSLGREKGSMKHTTCPTDPRLTLLIPPKLSQMECHGTYLGPIDSGPKSPGERWFFVSRILSGNNLGCTWVYGIPHFHTLHMWNTMMGGWAQHLPTAWGPGSWMNDVQLPNVPQL
jgi:hypothetical protein